MYEEVGLKIRKFDIAYIHESFISEYRAHSLVTVCRVHVDNNNSPQINDPDCEIVDIKWVSINKINEYIKNNKVAKPLLEWLQKNGTTTFYMLDRKLVWGDVNE